MGRSAPVRAPKGRTLAAFRPKGSSETGSPGDPHLPIALLRWPARSWRWMVQDGAGSGGGCSRSSSWSRLSRCRSARTSSPRREAGVSGLPVAQGAVGGAFHPDRRRASSPTTPTWSVRGRRGVPRAGASGTSRYREGPKRCARRSSKSASRTDPASRRTAIGSRTSSARLRSSASTETLRGRSRRARRRASPATTTGSSSERSSGVDDEVGPDATARELCVSASASDGEASSTTSAVTASATA